MRSADILTDKSLGNPSNCNDDIVVIRLGKYFEKFEIDVNQSLKRKSTTSNINNKNAERFGMN